MENKVSDVLRHQWAPVQLSVVKVKGNWNNPKLLLAKWSEFVAQPQSYFTYNLDTSTTENSQVFLCRQPDNNNMSFI